MDFFLYHLPIKLAQIANQCILHTNFYTQFFIKTGVYAPDEDPFNVAEDTVAGNTFVLLCAMIWRTSGPEFFLAWFQKHFTPLLNVLEKAYTTYMAYGVAYLEDKNQRCFPKPAVGCMLRRVPHVGLPDVFKSCALLRVLKERLLPSPVLRSSYPPSTSRALSSNPRAALSQSLCHI
ncbi:hypothetical protein MVEN_02108600 [Mycena venus]|uniref:Uncharacterized protein n=1 Tax=Mycena venus TaxID=2733690 RepID=A0A8H6X8U4_9AGAR|nr:hypothetical protein MVEN_02108600 [Mycena venus]